MGGKRRERVFKWGTNLDKAMSFIAIISFLRFCLSHCRRNKCIWQSYSRIFLLKRCKLLVWFKTLIRNCRFLFRKESAHFLNIESEFRYYSKYFLYCILQLQKIQMGLHIWKVQILNMQK